MGVVIRSVKYSSTYLNANKLAKIQEMDSNAKDLKNFISAYIHEHITEFFVDKAKFKARYSLFRYYHEFSAWTVQAIFHDVCTKYMNMYEQLIDNLKLVVQPSDKINTWVTKFYKVNDSKGRFKKGDLKEFSIKTTKSKFAPLVKWALKVGLDNMDSSLVGKGLIEDYWKSIRDNQLKLRSFVRLFHLVKNRIMSKFKIIEYTTGTYPLTNIVDGKGTIGSCLVFDSENSKYKHWFKIKVNGKGNDIFIPLQINDTYHARKPFDNSASYLVKVVGNRVDVITTYEVEEPMFFEQQKVVGLDLNAKHNFAALSDGKVFDYNRKYVVALVKRLKYFDKIGLNNLTEIQKKQLSKLCRINEWYFKHLVTDILRYCVTSGITDVVVEDLDVFGASFIRNVEFQNVKWSKLVRLLRLSNIKNWMLTQGEKYGVRVHTTPAPYTSKQCSQCGCIDDDNRKTQEDFKCVECGFESNADFNASLNICNRYNSGDVLQKELHNKDSYGRLVAKKLSVESVNKILLKQRANLKEKIAEVVTSV